jgi:hypothetical protein
VIGLVGWVNRLPVALYCAWVELSPGQALGSGAREALAMAAAAR